MDVEKIKTIGDAYMAACGVPAIDYCAANLGKRMYLLGSDYVFPHTANAVIKAQLKYIGGECVGEAYVPMHESDFY